MIVAVVLVVLYALYILNAAWQWNSVCRQGQQNSAVNGLPALPISLIIAYKNELANLPKLVKSIELLNYPANSLEVILVNDYSTDKGPEWLGKHCSYKLLNNLGQAGKKNALALGIAQASYENIVCSDADCELGVEMLWHISNTFTGQADMLLGPVVFIENKSFASRFATLENSSLVAIGLIEAANGRPSMANGANLSFKKEIYTKVGGYSQHVHINSGDDELLMHDFANAGAIILPLINSAAQVKTQTVNNWNDLLRQRIRWASKVKFFPKNKQLYYHFSHVLILMWIATLIFLFAFKQWEVAVGMQAAKLLCDMIWFTSIGGFFKLRAPLYYKLLTSLVQFFILACIYILHLNRMALKKL